MQKKGFIFHRTCGADVSRKADVARGTRTDATWHARPRGWAEVAHSRRGRVAGPHGSTRMPGGAPCGE